jgi:ppGpp synthetase/RelA/SpoT-type nucleotidyltranferase
VEIAVVAGPSKAQVNKAGQTVRRWIREGPNRDINDPRVDLALQVILDHRAAYQSPLAKATMGLRSMVKSEGCRVEVSQRLKRMTTIIDKLMREPTMALGNMQDIGGSRAVLDSIDELRRVEQRLRKNRPPLRVSDYISQPRASGYRGVHVVVAYPDKAGDDRGIEVQLRTRTMHEWAITVERMSGRLQQDLKSGYGPDEVLELLGAVSEAMAIEERGGVVGQDLIQRMKQLRTAAVPFITGGKV